MVFIKEAKSQKGFTDEMRESSQCCSHGHVLKVMIFNEFKCMFMLHTEQKKRKKKLIIIQIRTAVMYQAQSWKMFNHLSRTASWDSTSVARRVSSWSALSRVLVSFSQALSAFQWQRRCLIMNWCRFIRYRLHCEVLLVEMINGPLLPSRLYLIEREFHQHGCCYTLGACAYLISSPSLKGQRSNRVSLRDVVQQ